MKVFLTIVASCLVIAANGFAQELADVTVSVDNIAPSSGRIMVALEKDPAAFEKDAISKPFYLGQFVKADKKTITVVFKDVPHGTYAIKAFHDENNNQKLDTSLFGIPKEVYGFSKDARATFGPPEFKEASFQVDGAGDKHVVHLK